MIHKRVDNYLIRVVVLASEKNNGTQDTYKSRKQTGMFQLSKRGN